MARGPFSPRSNRLWMNHVSIYSRIKDFEGEKKTKINEAWVRNVTAPYSRLSTSKPPSPTRSLPGRRGVFLYKTHGEPVGGTNTHTRLYASRKDGINLGCPERQPFTFTFGPGKTEGNEKIRKKRQKKQDRAGTCCRQARQAIGVGWPVTLQERSPTFASSQTAAMYSPQSRPN